MKKIVSAVLCICLLMSLFAACAETEDELWEKYGETMTQLYSRVGDICFTMCGVPQCSLGHDDENFKNLRFLFYEDEKTCWNWIICDASGYMEHWKTLKPDADETERKALTLINFAASCMPGELEDYELVWMDEEQTHLSFYGICKDQDGEETDAFSVMDGNTVIMLIGPSSDQFRVMFSCVHLLSQQEKESAYWQERYVPHTEQIGRMEITFPAFTLQEDEALLRHRVCYTEDFNFIDMYYQPENIAAQYKSTDEMLEGITQMLTSDGEQLIRDGIVTAYAVEPFGEDCVLLKGTDELAEYGMPDSCIYFLVTPEGTYSLSGSASESLTETVNSVRRLGKEELASPELPRMTEENAVVYENRYLGYSLSIPSYFSAADDETNAAVTENMASDEETDALYDNHVWYYVPNGTEEVMFIVQLKECSTGSFEEELELAPMEAERQNEEARRLGMDLHYEMLFEPAMIETPMGEMSLRGLSVTNGNGAVHKHVYLDYYCNTIEYCFVLDAYGDYTVQQMLDLLSDIASTIHIDKVIE